MTRPVLSLVSLSAPLLVCWELRESRLAELEPVGEHSSGSSAKSVASAGKGACQRYSSSRDLLEADPVKKNPETHVSRGQSVRQEGPRV